MRPPASQESLWVPAGGSLERLDLLRLAMEEGSPLRRALANYGCCGTAVSWRCRWAMPSMGVKPALTSLSPPRAVNQNTAGGEARRRDNQALPLFPPQKFCNLTALAKQVNGSPSLPAQTLWTYDGFSPGPTFV